MKYTIPILSISLFSLFLMGCGSPGQPDPVDEPLENAGTPAEPADAEGGFKVPSFEVVISLSDKAMERLKNDGETIIAAAYLYGEAKDKSLHEKDQYNLGSHEVEIQPGGTATFEGIVIPQEKYEQLEDKDFFVNVNVYSGRKSSEFNLLSCGIVDGSISKVAGEGHRVECALIEE